MRSVVIALAALALAAAAHAGSIIDKDKDGTRKSLASPTVSSTALQCKTGRRCGNTCIPKGKACRLPNASVKTGHPKGGS